MLLYRYDSGIVPGSHAKRVGYPSMSVSVIPSYRVMMHMARRASGLAYADALDSLENGMRNYVRTQLAQMHASLVELGVRSVIGQLGDPEPDQLVSALTELDDARPQAVAQEALTIASEVLPRPDLSARMFMFPGDGESSVLVNQLGGVLGFSLGASATLLFVWPRGDWRAKSAIQRGSRIRPPGPQSSFPERNIGRQTRLYENSAARNPAGRDGRGGNIGLFRS